MLGRLSYVNNIVCGTVGRSTSVIVTDFAKTANFLQPSVILREFSKRNSEIDRSLIPKLNEDDLEEAFVKGHGPGGQNVNKSVNCCQLRHKPTGIVVKCHHSRLLDENRKLARELLIEKLDEHYNGDKSVKAQRERLLKKKSEETERKRKKLREMKQRYQEMVADGGNSS